MTRGKRAQLKLEALERALKYKFKDKHFVEEALTHASMAGPLDFDNQRLEFLGDRVLGLVVAQELMTRYPAESEGDLAPRLNALVRKETCAEAAQEIGLGEHLRMARSEAQTGGRKKMALLGDAMEAVIAAIYLDGGLEAAREFVLRQWGDRFNAHAEAPIDAKTALQEWAQARGYERPQYEVVDREGPDHAPMFTVEVRSPTGEAAQGVGASKRAAEQAAAKSLLEAIGDET